MGAAATQHVKAEWRRAVGSPATPHHWRRSESRERHIHSLGPKSTLQISTVRCKRVECISSTVWDKLCSPDLNPAEHCGISCLRPAVLADFVSNAGWKNWIWSEGGVSSVRRWGQSTVDVVWSWHIQPRLMFVPWMKCGHCDTATIRPVSSHRNLPVYRTLTNRSQLTDCRLL